MRKRMVSAKAAGKEQVVSLSRARAFLRSSVNHRRGAHAAHMPLQHAEGHNR